MESTERISIEEFRKIDLRVGTISEVTKVEGTKKLLKIIVDIGAEKRTIVSGIGDRYTAATLTGKQIILVANLKPATIRGVDSDGMLLAADIDGVAYIATFDEDVPMGSSVR